MNRPPTLAELARRAAANDPTGASLASLTITEASPAPSTAPQAPSSPSLPPPDPCPVCSNTIQWLDAYRRWHCIECEPYVSRRQARKKIFLVTEFSNDGSQEKISWSEMDLETSEEIKISEPVAEQKFEISKLPFYAAGAKPSTVSQSPLIAEAFAAKLVPPPDSGLTVEEWWKGELTERTQVIDEVTAGKWKNAFVPKNQNNRSTPPATAKTPNKVANQSLAEHFPTMRPSG